CWPTRPGAWPVKPARPVKQARPAASRHGGFAEERLHLGVEVRNRGDAILRAELERARGFGRVARERDFRLARVGAHDVAELAQDAGRRLAGVDLEPHLARRYVGGELGDLDRDQLGLALLVVDPALEDEHAVGLAQLAR